MILNERRKDGWYVRWSELNVETMELSSEKPGHWQILGEIAFFRAREITPPFRSARRKTQQLFNGKFARGAFSIKRPRRTL